MKNEKKYYDEEYWFNNTEKHNHNQEVDGYGKDYYAYKIFENLIVKLNDLPKEGKIVVMGTNKCVSFDLLCQVFGYDRCIGFDIANPTGHPNVIIQDCSNTSLLPDIDIAFVHNDIGSFPLTPKLKYDVQLWAAQRVIEGGYFLSRNNLNSGKFKLEDLMEKYGFYNTQFECLKGIIDLSMLDVKTIEGHMLSKKITREIWDV